MIFRNIIKLFFLYLLVAFHTLLESCHPKENIDPNDISISFDDLSIEEIPMNYYPKKIDFWDNSIGYAITWDSLIIKTINGGLDWKVIGETDYILESIQVVNSDMAVAYGWQANNERGMIFLIDGNDDSIQLKEIELSGTVSQVHFLNDYIGFGLGQGIFLKTLDSGTTWEEVDFEFTTFTFIMLSNNGNLITNSNIGLNISEDYGQTWFKKKCDILPIAMIETESNYFFHSISQIEFYNKKFSDKRKISGSSYISGLNILDPNSIIIFGYEWITTEDGITPFYPNSTISITNDSGKSWIKMYPARFEKITQADFINKKSGFAIADDLTGQASSLLKIEILK